MANPAPFRPRLSPFAGDADCSAEDLDGTDPGWRFRSWNSRHLTPGYDMSPFQGMEMSG